MDRPLCGSLLLVLSIIDKHPWLCLMGRVGTPFGCVHRSHITELQQALLGGSLQSLCHLPPAAGPETSCFCKPQLPLVSAGFVFSANQVAMRPWHDSFPCLSSFVYGTTGFSLLVKGLFMTYAYLLEGLTVFLLSWKSYLYNLDNDSLSVLDIKTNQSLCVSLICFLCLGDSFQIDIFSFDEVESVIFHLLFVLLATFKRNSS